MDTCNEEVWTGFAQQSPFLHNNPEEELPDRHGEGIVAVVREYMSIATQGK